MNKSYDVAVVGSGFAGSIMAMIAHRLGRSTVLIDKVKHPRVVIGESSTPLTNLLLEELASRYDLPALRSLSKWGSWQQEYPGIGCGLKRGFTFYHHDRRRPDPSIPSRQRQLLVAASPNDQVADTHWYRADFDQLLVRQAESMGVDYFDETNLTSASSSQNGVTVEGKRKGDSFKVRSNFLIDATGPRGYLHRVLDLGETELPNYPRTQALYSHFSGVTRLDDLPFGDNLETPPYPIDEAAVHHVFDGGWVWVLRFNNGITSAGVAATNAVTGELNFADGPGAWRRLLLDIPVLRDQFAGATLQRPFTHLKRLSFRSRTIAGHNWALLPSAAGFVDPLLSTGFPLALLGIARLAELLEKAWDSDHFPARLRTYAAETDQELLASARLLAGLYANMNDFPIFSALSLLYFAASTYSETVRRLDKERLAKAFLLQDHPHFTAAMRSLLGRAERPRGDLESKALIKDVLQVIEPFNVAGLGDTQRNNWYPVNVQDLFCSASKVGATHDDIAALLERSGFGAPPIIHSHS